MLPQRPRNVLNLCADEHARAVTGCYGHGVVKTPALDRLASLGTRFDAAVTPSPICIPARASIATGLQVHEHRCWSSAEPWHGQQESWMHALRQRGHAVVSVGKLHFRSPDDDNGFSEEILPMHAAGGGAGWLTGLLRDPLPDYGETAEFARDVGPGDSDYTEYDRRVTDESCRWLQKWPRRIKDRPWALFVSFASPHYPLKAPLDQYLLYEGVPIPDAFGRHPGERPEHPVLDEIARFYNYDDYFDEGLRREARRCYFGLTSFLDDNVRKVMEALEDSGAARDTVVIYMADHGEMLGNLGFWTKSVMYEDSVAVPLIMAGPGIPEAAAAATPCSLTDVAATVEDIVGLKRAPSREPWQTMSLRGLIDRPRPDRFVFSEYHDGGSPVSFYMVRQGAWKYVCYVGGHPPQLFNLANDPHELRDLGTSRHHERARDHMHMLLTSIVDPDAVAAQCLADQARVIARHGGREAILAAMGFGHTPVKV